MSLVIRFSRMGRKGERKYRVVVKEKRSKRDGYAIDYIGSVTKTAKKVSKNLDMKKLEFWKRRGAIISPAVESYLDK